MGEGHTRALAFGCVCVFQSENNFWESALSFHRVSPRDGNQIVSLDNKRLCSLSHLTKPGCSLHFNYNLLNHLESSSEAQIILRHITNPTLLSVSSLTLTVMI